MSSANKATKDEQETNVESRAGATMDCAEHIHEEKSEARLRPSRPTRRLLHGLHTAPSRSFYQVIGALGASLIADLLGRKRTFMIAFLLSYAAITVEVVATTNGMFFGGNFLNGFAIGTLKAASASYIGEVAPIALRGLMTCFIGLGYTIGLLIVSLIVTHWLDSQPLGLPCSLLLLICGCHYLRGICLLHARIPWWLVRKQRDVLALRSLRRLGHNEADAETTLIEIKDTLEKIRQENEGATYLECFPQIKPSTNNHLHRTPTYPSFCGCALYQFILYVLRTARRLLYGNAFPSHDCPAGSLPGRQCRSWFLIDRIGRRSLIIYGTTALSIALWLMAGLAVAGTMSTVRGAVCMILIYGFAYNVGIGAVSFTILAESSTSRLRMKTIAIGLACQNSVYLGWSFALPCLFNPDQLNLGGKVGFIFGGTSIICMIYLWF
ncbi:hypothetical protein ACJZ2D_001720 [Fusarium nematophilum]